MPIKIFLHKTHSRNLCKITSILSRKQVNSLMSTYTDTNKKINPKCEIQIAINMQENVYL